MRIADLLTWFIFTLAAYFVLVIISCFVGWHQPYWMIADWHPVARLILFIFSFIALVVACWPESGSSRGSPRPIPKVKERNP